MNQSSRRHSLYESLLLDQGENPQAGRTPGLWVFGFSYADHMVQLCRSRSKRALTVRIGAWKKYKVQRRGQSKRAERL